MNIIRIDNEIRVCGVLQDFFLFRLLLLLAFVHGLSLSFFFRLHDAAKTSFLCVATIKLSVRRICIEKYNATNLTECWWHEWNWRVEEKNKFLFLQFFFLTFNLWFIFIYLYIYKYMWLLLHSFILKKKSCFVKYSLLYRKINQFHSKLNNYINNVIIYYI